VTQCAVCQRVKPTRQPRPPLQPLQVPAKPFSQITLDWLGGFPANKEGNDSVLNIIDKFTKWAIVIPCNKEMTAAKLAELLYNRVFSWVGLPMSIVGDRDSRLTSLYMRTLCKHLRVKLKLSTSYHPQTDGQTENFNSTLLQMLRCFVNPFHTD
jgi:transposase InsO family protein